MDVLDQDEEADILPGGDVKYGEAPYVAAVFNAFFKYHTCTGIIVKSDFVLAAGYCVLKDGKTVAAEHVTILSGVVDFRDHEMDQWRHAVKIHELPVTYEGGTVLVLIKVHEPFYINFSTSIITYKPKEFKSYEGCKAISWRFHDKFNRLTLRSLVLKKSNGIVMNKMRCSEEEERLNVPLRKLEGVEFLCMTSNPDEYRHNRLDDNFDCLGFDGSCLFCSEDKLPVAVGIAINYTGVSKCNRFDVSYAFTQIKNYSLWIDHVLREDGIYSDD